MSDQNKVAAEQKEQGGEYRQRFEEWIVVFADMAAEVEKRVQEPILRELVFRAAVKSLYRDAL